MWTVISGLRVGEMARGKLVCPILPKMPWRRRLLGSGTHPSIPEQRKQEEERQGGSKPLAAWMLTEPLCSACCTVGRSLVAHQTSAMRHLCVVFTLHWLRVKYTAFILWICTCHGGSSCCTRPNTWLRNRSVSPRTWGQKKKRVIRRGKQTRGEGAGRGQVTWVLTS